MDDTQFNAILTNRLTKIKAVLGSKAKEYGYGDRLSNLKRAAEIQRITPEQVAWNFCMKHLVSIQDMIESKSEYSSAQWDEKLGDAINYLILIGAISQEAKGVN